MGLRAPSLDPFPYQIGLGGALWTGRNPWS